MEFISTRVTLQQDLSSNEFVISFRTNNKNVLTEFEKIKEDKKINVQAKKYRKKRSLDANAYAWVLCDKIGKELSKDDTIITKEDVYRDAILQIGAFEPFLVQEKTFEKVKSIWEKQGLGFIVQEVSRKDKCIKVHCYYGSSSYDSKEMSLLIKLLVELAVSLNIETKTEAELKSLVNSWG